MKVPTWKSQAHIMLQAANSQSSEARVCGRRATPCSPPGPSRGRRRAAFHENFKEISLRERVTDYPTEIPWLLQAKEKTHVDFRQLKPDTQLLPPSRAEKSIDAFPNEKALMNYKIYKKMKLILVAQSKWQLRVENNG